MLILKNKSLILILVVSARKIGVRREIILFIEKGNYSPSIQLAHDIAKALQTTIDDLFIFDD
jgi:putative transcriptional regulator